MSEYVVLVDDNDRPIGVQEKIKAHEDAACHRAFSVFIYRQHQEEGIELLLQQRHQDKYHCAGLWTNTCCGHPRPDEETTLAAERRLFEEMGLKITLTPAGKFHYIAAFANGLTENEIDHVFVGKMEDMMIVAHPEEVQAYQWMKLSVLQEKLVHEVSSFTPWLSRALRIALPFFL